MPDEPRAGLLAEFSDADGMLRAIQGLRGEGYSRLGTYSPYPLDEAVDALGLARPPLARWALGAGSVGAALALFVQWYTNAWDYPVNVGSRPLLAISAWIQISVASGFLFAGLATFVGFCAAARLLTLWHPVFEVDGFERASVDRFWAAVGSDDPRCHPLGTAETLRRYGALRVVSLREDPGCPLSRRLRALSAGALPAVAFTLSFAAVDWLMSLVPLWPSAAWGLYFFAGALVGALGVVAVLAAVPRREGVPGEALSVSHVHALGKLPLGALLSWRLKRSPAAVAAVGAWLVLMHYVDLYWTVVPALHPAGLAPHWLDLAALLGVGGVAAGFGAWRMRSRPVMPTGDPEVRPALEYTTR